MQWIIPGIILSYIIGSIPTAYIFGRALKGIDIRKHGSGNIGATNAMRVLGKRAGITVLLLDALKGFFPVFFIGGFLMHRQAAVSADLLFMFLGLAAICGHNWTVFLNFKGGKGVATTLGVMVALSFKIAGLGAVLLCLIAVWFIVFLFIRIVSIASVITAVALPVLLHLFKQPLSVVSMGVILAFFAVIRHRSNIRRFLKGEEPRLNLRK